MIPRLRRDDDAAPPVPIARPGASPVRSTDLVDGWLRVFLTLLKGPAAQADPIREELESHLRERTRDLMLAGTAEAEATRQAISELGEAADVAARYRALRTEPRRRLLMHASLFTVAGAALALSIAAMTGQQPAKPDAKADPTRQLLIDSLMRRPEMSSEPLIVDLLNRSAIDGQRSPEYRARLLDQIRLARAGETEQHSAVAYVPPSAPAELDAIRADWDLNDASVGDAFEFLGKLANMPVQVRWDQLKAAGLEAKATITVRAKQAGVAPLFRAVNERIGATGGQAVDCRAADGVIVVATREYFDRREMELASYDLSGVVAARIETYQEQRERIVSEITQAITQFVSPADWEQNGGDLAHYSVVGDRLFVQAPARLHPQIKWILSQLPAGERHSDAAPAKEEPVLRVYALKHTAATEALETLKRVESIRAIDFTSVTTDSHTNSLIARATPSLQLALQVALDTLDRPAAGNHPK